MNMNKAIGIGCIVESEGGAVIGKVTGIAIDEFNEPHLFLHDPENPRVWLYQGCPISAKHFHVRQAQA
jgi:hypothetical protein